MAVNEVIEIRDAKKLGVQGLHMSVVKATDTRKSWEIGVER